MPEPGKVTIRLDPPADARKKNWCKELSGVDPTKKDGHAFLMSQWVDLGKTTTVDAGALLMRYEEKGSAKTPEPLVQVLRVEWDGSVSVVDDRFGPLVAKGYDWVNDLKERVQDLLATPLEDGQQVMETRLTVFVTPGVDNQISAAFDGRIVGRWADWESAATGLVDQIKENLA